MTEIGEMAVNLPDHKILKILETNDELKKKPELLDRIIILYK